MKQLIVTADDFGHTSDINRAVIRAHGEGILTAASLMVNEPHAPGRWPWPRRLRPWPWGSIWR